MEKFPVSKMCCFNWRNNCLSVRPRLWRARLVLLKFQNTYKSESERSLDAACEKMEEALKLEQERELMVDAALENARVQLQQ
jgi:hypothetical protein